MPIYCFTSNGGETIEEFFPMGKAPEFVLQERGHSDDESGVYMEEFTRNVPAEWAGGQKSGEKGTWPVVCYASGVHASQARELRRHFMEHGCPTEVTSDGDPVYRDHQHRKRALKCRGLHDKASFGT